MVKIYVRLYTPKIKSGEMTLEEVLSLIPLKWRDDVRQELINIGG